MVEKHTSTNTELIAYKGCLYSPFIIVNIDPS